jgi:cell division protein FtsI (penicillin-binding protein 3)
VVTAVVLLGQSARLQLLESRQWRGRANQQHTAVTTLVAPRGMVLDDRGEPLAVSRDQVRLTVAPNQVYGGGRVPDLRDSLSRLLHELGVPRSVTARFRDSTRTYVAIPGLFLPSDARHVMAMRGVRTEWSTQRLLSGTPGIQRLIGAVDAEGTAQGGIEQALDSLLRGSSGERRVLRDRRGRYLDAPTGGRRDARSGPTVQLTINRRLQEFVERELLAAMQRTGASGGDFVVVDPRDGAIMAAAGARDGAIAPSVTPLTQAYQPGSILKPLFVAWWLDQGRVRPDERINTENGRWTVGARTITDEHKEASMTVFDVVRWSSNVGMAKLVSDRMSHAEEYRLLRDFGFGVPTGVSYPSESRGALPDPKRWSLQSAVSLAIGYELATTPLQLAMAYAAIANGGTLLEPALVREIRADDGTLRYRHAAHVVRRVATPHSTSVVRAMLKAVVDSGTGRAAGLTAFDVGGKSGTARRVIDGQYAVGRYDATFAGMFPAADPQFVIVARLIDPQTAIFGGVVAAPMLRGMLQGAIAARSAVADRSALTSGEESFGTESGVIRTPPVAAVTSGVPQAVSQGARTGVPPVQRYVASLAVRTPRRAAPVDSGPNASGGTYRTVPDVGLLTVRDAVRALHEAGFRVRVDRRVATATGAPPPVQTVPQAGSVARRGSAIQLVLAQGGRAP